MLRLNTILHPTDFSERSNYAFRLACSLARDHGARLVILHVWLPPSGALAAGEVAIPLRPEDYPPGALEEQLRRLQAPDPAVDVEHRLEQGNAPVEIIEVARETNCDLIVMGTHGRTGLGRLLMGSVAEQVMRKAPCPVLTVKAPFPSAESVSEPLASSASHA